MPMPARPSDPIDGWTPKVGEYAIYEHAGRGRIVGINAGRVHMLIDGRRVPVSANSPYLHPPTWTPPIRAPAPRSSPRRDTSQADRPKAREGGPKAKRTSHVGTGVPPAILADLRAAGFHVGRVPMGYVVRLHASDRQPILVLTKSKMRRSLDPAHPSEVGAGRRWPADLPDPYFALRNGFREWASAESPYDRIVSLRTARAESIKLLELVRRREPARWVQFVNGGLGK